ncbi:calcium/proton exchanger [Tanacetum coccineum]
MLVLVSVQVKEVKKQVQIDDSLDEGSTKQADGSSHKGKGKLGEDRSEPSKVSQATKERWRKKKLEEKENLKNAVDCPFRLWASWMSTEKSFQIKTLYHDHKCCINYNLGSLVTYRWITEHYAREIIDNPWGSYNYMQNSKRSKFMINVSLGRCKRAKRASLFDHEGAGWLEGCRKVIGLDGCFLTHICKGKLLTAMGRDENNQMFLIVWAVVGVENKNNWTWFLSLLSDDLNLDHGAGLTVISDGHKGLLEAVKIWLPDAEQRQSASSLNEQFLEVMEEIKALDENAYSWLVDHDPNTWCRAYFELDRSCAAFENGISKSFNSKILSARGKPIITMLEDIRVYIMQKVWFLNKTAMELNDSIKPFTIRHLKFMKIRQRKWVVYASGFQEVEVRRQDEAFGVNIHLKKRACKMPVLGIKLWKKVKGNYQTNINKLVQVLMKYQSIKEDPVMPQSNSGNKRKETLVKKKSSQVNESGGRKSNLTPEHAEIVDKEAFADLVRKDVENKAKDEEIEEQENRIGIMLSVDDEHIIGNTEPVNPAEQTHVIASASSAPVDEQPETSQDPSTEKVGSSAPVDQFQNLKIQKRRLTKEKRKQIQNNHYLLGSTTKTKGDQKGLQSSRPKSSNLMQMAQDLLLRKLLMSVIDCFRMNVNPG